MTPREDLIPHIKTDRVWGINPVSDVLVMDPDQRAACLAWLDRTEPTNEREASS